MTLQLVFGHILLYASNQSSSAISREESGNALFLPFQFGFGGEKAYQG